MSMFISLNTNGNKKIITIDGSASKASKTTFDDEDAGVQLRKARTEESGFNWKLKLPIDEVIVKNVVVYDEYDIGCVAWFIENKIKIDLTNAYIFPKCMGKLITTFNDLKRSGFTVIKGSAINVQLSDEMILSQVVKAVAEKIGFIVHRGSFLNKA